MRKPITVKQLGNYIQNQILIDPFLRNVLVIGEIVNLNKRNYIYFSLKEEDDMISCILFNSEFHFQEGDKVIIEGSIITYMRDSKYQIRVKKISQVGAGDTVLSLEKLKEKLSSMGYFDSDRKKNIPLFPRKIGLITGNESAAYYDFVKILNDSKYDCEVFLYSTLVQGDNAVREVSNAILELNKYDLDLIVISRGGGSKQDLAVFNSEEIANEIFYSNTPVISAVGHEIDFTITDLVSDLRVSTPTKAAEYIVKNYNISKESILNYYKYNNFIVNNIFNNYSNLIKTIYFDIKSKSPEIMLEKVNKIIDNFNLNNKIILDSIVYKYFESITNLNIDINKKIEKILNKSRVNIKTINNKFISLEDMLVGNEYILFNEKGSFRIKVEEKYE